MKSGLTYILLFIITFIGAWFLSALANQNKKTEKAGPGSRSGGFPRFGCLSFFVLLLILGCFVFMFAFLQSFHSFTNEQIIAYIECFPDSGREQGDFDLVLTPIVRGKKQTSQLYNIKGDKWLIGGDILQWEPVVNFLGLTAMYRLSRLQGQYIHADDENQQNRTAYALVENEDSEFWNNLYKSADKIPFIKSVYQNYVGHYPLYGEQFVVKVSISGYTTEIIKNIEKE